MRRGNYSISREVFSTVSMSGDAESFREVLILRAIFINYPPLNDIFQINLI